MIKDIKAIEIDKEKQKQFWLICGKDLYKFSTEDNQSLTLKWVNSIKLVQEIGDLNNMDPNRYMAQSIYHN